LLVFGQVEYYEVQSGVGVTLGERRWVVCNGGGGCSGTDNSQATEVFLPQMFHLCRSKPWAPGKFCHSHLIASWLTNAEVPS